MRQGTSFVVLDTAVIGPVARAGVALACTESESTPQECKQCVCVDSTPQLPGRAHAPTVASRCKCVSVPEVAHRQGPVSANQPREKVPPKAAMGDAPAGASVWMLLIRSDNQT